MGSPEKTYDPRNTFVNVSDTKFGMFPKFLMKTSGFVRYGEHNKKVDTEENKNDNFMKNLMPKKLNFNNAINMNYANNNNTEESGNSSNRNHHGNVRASSISVTPNIYIDNAFTYNEDKNKLISKTSSNGFVFNSQNIKNMNNINIQNSSKGIDCSNKNNFNDLNRKYSSTYFNNNNFSNTNNLLSNKNSIKNTMSTGYISNKGYEINSLKNSVSISKKNNRKVFLDYPQIKFPIQPYKKFNLKKKENTNYLINGSLVDNVDMINNIRILNEKISSNFKKDKEILITNQMTNNIEKLNNIEKKINKLIESSRDTMKENHEYRKFNSNSSIIIIK